jgi:hypothetical protein
MVVVEGSAEVASSAEESSVERCTSGSLIARIAREGLETAKLTKQIDAMPKVGG